jgi:hypothetical protein
LEVAVSLDACSCTDNAWQLRRRRRESLEEQQELLRTCKSASPN